MIHLQVHTDVNEGNSDILQMLADQPASRTGINRHEDKIHFVQQAKIVFRNQAAMADKSIAHWCVALGEVLNFSQLPLQVIQTGRPRSPKRIVRFELITIEQVDFLYRRFGHQVENCVF